MIYTRTGTPVNICNVKREMQKSPRGDEFEAVMVRLEYAQDSEDGSCKAGTFLFGGQFENAAHCLVADGGWNEIMDEAEAVERLAGFVSGVTKVA